MKKHETGKPKAAAKKGAKDKKDTNLPFPSLGKLIESQISFAEDLLRQFARSEEQALVPKAKLKRATTNLSKHLTEDKVELFTSVANGCSVADERRFADVCSKAQ